MRLILAILLPWLQFFTIGRPLAGIICLLLQLTLIGWLPRITSYNVCYTKLLRTRHRRFWWYQSSGPGFLSPRLPTPDPRRNNFV